MKFKDTMISKVNSMVTYNCAIFKSIIFGQAGKTEHKESMSMDTRL